MMSQCRYHVVPGSMPRHLVVIVMIDAVTVDVTVVIDGVVARHSGDVDLDTADSTHSLIHSFISLIKRSVQQ